MKNEYRILLALAVNSLVAPATNAQLAINWFTIDAGGGMSTGGGYAVTSTIGQPDAGRLTGGNYTLVGGFWGVIQNGLPQLNIKKQAGQLVLSWPADQEQLSLQSATQFVPGGGDWSNFTGNVVRTGNEFEFIIGPVLTPPNPIRFFRLRRQ